MKINKIMIGWLFVVLMSEKVQAVEMPPTVEAVQVVEETQAVEAVQVAVSKDKKTELAIQDREVLYTNQALWFTPKMIEKKTDVNNFGDIEEGTEGGSNSIIRIYQYRITDLDTKVDGVTDTTDGTGEIDETGESDGNDESGKIGQGDGFNENGGISKNGKWMDFPAEEVEINLADGSYEIEFRGIVKAQDNSIQTATESVAYRLCFDRVVPELNVASETDLSNWQREEISCEVGATDDRSGISDLNCHRKEAILWEQNTFEESNRRQVKCTFILSEETPKEGLEFIVCATDRAGNSVEYVGTYYLDRTAPVVSLSGITDGQLLSVAGTLDIRVLEAIYESAEVVIETSRMYAGTAQALEAATYPLTAEETVQNRIYDQDGIYTVLIRAQDQAGNQGETLRLVFRVDVTAPVLLLEGVESGGLYCTEKELKASVEEEFYQGMQTAVSAKRETPGKSFAYDMGNFALTERRSELTHTFKEDGIYRIQIDATDEAGHSGETKEARFMIDRNAPHIMISGIADQEKTSKAPLIRFQTEELFYDQEIVTIAAICTGVEGVSQMMDMPVFKCPAEVSELAYPVPQEGKYQIAVHAQDAVGNLEQESFSFIYDCTPPDIGYLDQIDQSYQKQFSFPKNFKEEIQDLTAVTYKIYVNQKRFDETDTISDAGKYVVSVEAVDEVGNIALKTVEFIILEEKAEAGIRQTAKNSIKERKVPLSSRMTEGAEEERSGAAGQSEGVETDLEKQKKMQIEISLICGTLVAAGAIFLALRRIDRKNGA